jgi:hypothetical protein
MKQLTRVLIAAPLLAVLIAGFGAAAPRGEEICPESGKPTWQCCSRKGNMPPCCQRTRCHDSDDRAAETGS